MISFGTLATATAIAGFLLAMGWLFAGSVMIRRWGGEPSDMALVIGRRIGVVYFSLALLFLLARNTASAELIIYLSILGLFAMSLLAGLGIFEFVNKRVNATMLISVGVEILLAIGFAQLIF